MNRRFWLIEPRDSLIVRDGKPFGAEVGNRADSLEFPFPATTTGVARTRAGLSTIDGDLANFTKGLGDEVQREIEVTGAILAEISDEGQPELLIPAPADAVLFELGTESDAAKVIPLVPLETENGVRSDVDRGNDGVGLRLLGLKKGLKNKPHKKAPKFWRWDEFESWLSDPQITEFSDLEKLGIVGLEKDRRVHVKMNYKTKSGEEGGLFETRGLEFVRKIKHRGEGVASFKRYGLILRVDTNDFDGEIKAGIAPMGGERRLVAWSETEKLFPEIPDEMKQRIVKDRSCRLVLLTPAVFANGFLPRFQNEVGLKLDVEAAAVNRYQVISGWDFKISKPKPTRRVCPAGSVFFLRLDGDEEAIRKWIEKVWFQPVSDDLQARKDGFGLAVIGAWNGEYLKLEDALEYEKDHR